MLDSMVGHKKKIIRVVIQGVSINSGIHCCTNTLVKLFFLEIQISRISSLPTHNPFCNVQFYIVHIKPVFYWCRRLNLKSLNLQIVEYILTFHVSSTVQFSILFEVYCRIDLKFDFYDSGPFIPHALNYFYFNHCKTLSWSFTEFKAKTPVSVASISVSLSVQPISHCSFWFTCLLSGPVIVNRWRIM